jgi:hypothetical protein
VWSLSRDIYERSCCVDPMFTQDPTSRNQDPTSRNQVPLIYFGVAVWWLILRHPNRQEAITTFNKNMILLCASL